jgi:hypothetical protein
MLHNRKAGIATYKTNVLLFLRQNKADLMFLTYCIFIGLLFTLNPRLLNLAYGLIDPSFNYAVDTAGAQRLAFGSGFIATYGPLGYLVANYLPSKFLIANLWLLAYAFLISVGVYIFTKQYVNKSIYRWVAAAIILYAFNIGSRGGFVEWGYLCSVLLFCFIYLKATTRSRWFILALLVVLSVIFSLTKFTLGFGSILSLLLVVIFAPRAGSLKKRAICTGAVIIAYIIGFLAIGHHLGITNPAAYVKTGFILSNKFSSAMSFFDPQTATATVAVFVAIASLAVWVLYNEKRSFTRYLFLSPSFLLIWKYCIVRQDGHINAILSVILPLAVLYYFVISSKRVKDIFFLQLVLLCCFTSIWSNKIPFYGNDGFAALISTPINRVIHGDFEKFFELSQQKKSWAVYSAAQLGGAALPSSMRTQIGSQGVDVFPWETSIIAANNLTWQGRPSPFSFETYDPYLDNLNASFFASNKAPTYIVWHSTGANNLYGVDYRNVLWDEPATLRMMLERYDVADSDHTFMLLKKRPSPVDLSYSKVKFTTKSGINTPWKSVSTSPLKPLAFAYFSVQETYIQKLEEAAIRGNVYYMQVRTADKKTFTYRFTKENSSQGYLLGGLPVNWNQLIALFKTHASDPATQLTSYRIIYSIPQSQ